MPKMISLCHGLADLTHKRSKQQRHRGIPIDTCQDINYSEQLHLQLFTGSFNQNAKLTDTIVDPRLKIHLSTICSSAQEQPFVSFKPFLLKLTASQGSAVFSHCFCHFIVFQMVLPPCCTLSPISLHADAFLHKLHSLELNLSL